MHGRSLAGLSRTTLHLGDPAAALVYAERAVTASPGAETLLARAKAYTALGKADLARKDLEEAARRDRSYRDTVQALLRNLERPR
jgi:tetratricopeptide (TPR) repeat protein